MFHNYYHLPVFRSLRSIARKMKILNILKKIVGNNASYEEPFHEALKKSIKIGDIVWDVGANVGFYTNLFLDWVGKEGKVIAFEPMPSTFFALDKSLGTSTNIMLVQKALSENAGVSYFSASRENDVTAHLVEKENNETLKVEVTTADLITKNDSTLQPNVIKIDVEGFEEDVLKGGMITFSNKKCRHILVEMHFTRMDERNLKDSPNRIVKMLKNWGYKVKWVDASHIHAIRKSR